MPVRSLSLVFMAVVCAAAVLPARGEDSPALGEPFRIVAPFEDVQLMPGEDALVQECGTTQTIGACTRLYARRLDCGCFPDGDHWHVHARAQFIPRIVIGRRDALEHERMHINEIRRSLEAHLSTFTAIEYHSSAECENSARAASASFPSVMDRFQRDSNVRHHPMYVHALEEKRE